MTMVAAGSRITVRFSLVELMLALIVIGISIVAAVALLPAGLHHSRDATAESYVADFAGHFSAYIANEIRTNWDSYVDLDAGTLRLPVRTGGVYNLPVTDDSQEPASAWHEVATGRLWRYEGSPQRPGLFLAVQQTQETEDLRAAIRVWQTRVTTQVMDADGSPTLADFGAGAAVAVNIEISWPQQVEYAQRHRHTFQALVFRDE